MELNILLGLMGFSFVILLGFISEMLFDRSHIPDVLILFLVGIFLGPIMHWISADSFSAIEPIFVSLALMLIIFEGSLNIKLNDFIKGAGPGSSLSLLFFLTSIAIIAPIMWLLGYDISLGILLGAILGGTSSAVVIPIIKLLKLENESSMILTLESTVTDVLCIVGAISFANIMMIKEFHPAAIALNLVSTFLIAVLLGIGSAVIWIFLRSKFPQISKAYMLSIAYIIMMYVLAEIMNSNGAITILAFAIFLGNSKHFLKYVNTDVEYRLNDAEKNFYSEISFFLKVFFFVYLGILIDLSNVYLLFIGLLLTIIIAIARPFVVRLALKSKDLPKKDLTVMSIMSPKGMAAAVLAQITLRSEYFQSIPQANDLTTITFSVILFSIIATSFMVFYFEKFVFSKYKEHKATPQKA